MTKEEQTEQKEKFKDNKKILFELMPELSQYVSRVEIFNQIITQQQTETGQNLLLSDELYYPSSAEETIKSHFENLDNYFFPVSPNIFKKSFSSDLVAEEFVSRLNQLSLQSEVKKLKLSQSQEVLQTRKTFMVFGLGLAKHIKAIIEKFEPKEIHIIETNLALWQYIASEVNWREIQELTKKYKVKLRAINLYRHSVDSAKNYLFEYFVFGNKPATNGYVLYMHKDSLFFQELITYILGEGQRLFTANGYVIDENKMYLHTYKNTINPNNLYLSEKKTNLLDPKIIIAASGPSIEDHYTIIKKLSSSSIVFSCGTGLSGLLKNGITPDFHFELENSKEVYMSLSSIGEKFDLSKIRLVCSTTVNPKVCDLFKTSLLVLRSGPGVCRLYTGLIKKLINSEPSVANLALAFGLESGFNEIYLFGCDFGSAVQDKHHSQDVDYYTNQELYSKQLKDNPLIKQNFEFSEKRYGNFGKTCYTNFLYSFYSKPIEEFTIMYPYSKIYNVSDGIRVEGTIPKLAKLLDFEPLSESEKQQNINIVLANFEDSAKIKSQATSLIKQLFKTWHEIEKEIINKLNSKTKSFSSKKELIVFLEEILQVMEFEKNEKDISKYSLSISFLGSFAKAASFTTQFLEEYQSKNEKKFLNEVYDTFKQQILALIQSFNSNEANFY